MKIEPRLSTTRLLAKGSARERTAAARVLEAYEPLLVAAVRKYLGARRFAGEGEDLLQDVRLRVCRSLPALRGKSRAALSSWLKRVVKSAIVDWERRRSARRRHPSRTLIRLDGTHAPDVASKEGTPSRVYLGEENRGRVRQAIEAVPARYRETLRYICENDPKPDELIRFTGKPPEASRKFVARALEHLRRKLSPDGRT